MHSPLQGHSALVTGAGTRLGAAIAAGLAAQGCRMVLHCHRSSRPARTLALKIRQAGGEAVVLRADLSRAAEALKLARAAEAAFGRVDILINNAAVFRPTPLEKLNEREFDAFIQLNLKAPYLLSAQLGRHMKRRGGGAIINIACLSAFQPWKSHLPYSISKAGVVALTVGLAKLLAPEVRVNAIAPGTVLPPARLKRAEVEALRRRIPLQKIGSPGDVVDAVLYLLNAPFVTGQVLKIDGGRGI